MKFDMKKAILSLVLISISISSFNQIRGIKILEDPLFQIDSINEFFWSNDDGEWVSNGNWKNPNVHRFFREEGLVTMILVTSRETGENIKKELKMYDSQDRMISHVYQEWEENSWINVRRDLLNYDDAGRRSEFVIQKWFNSSWQNVTRFTDYQYSDAEQVLKYTEQTWNNNAWESFAVNTRTYTEEGLPLVRINKFIGGTYRYRQSYTWYLDQNKSELVHQPFDETTGNFRNGVNTIYMYNDCMQTLSETRQHFNDNQWVNYSKKVYFRSLVIEPELKKHVRIPVCHNGHTIYVPYSALKAHLSHGDCIGECSEYFYSRNIGQKKKSDVSQESLTLTNSNVQIFPNPIQEHTTISLPEDHRLSTLQIIDMQGKIVRLIGLEDRISIRLGKQGLVDGIYIFRFAGPTETLNIRVMVD